MNQLIRQLSTVFTAGVAGALVNTWVVWYLGRRGIPQSFGVAIAPAWTKAFVYPRLVWGGLWGGLFLLPIGRGGSWLRTLTQGFLVSLGPTLFQLLYVFPILQQQTLLGLHLGHLTPIYVLLVNLVWGVTGAIWLRCCGR